MKNTIKLIGYTIAFFMLMIIGNDLKAQMATSKLQTSQLNTLTVINSSIQELNDFTTLSFTYAPTFSASTAYATQGALIRTNTVSVSSLSFAVPSGTWEVMGGIIDWVGNVPNIQFILYDGDVQYTEGNGNLFYCTGCNSSFRTLGSISAISTNTIYVGTGMSYITNQGNSTFTNRVFITGNVWYACISLGGYTTGTISPNFRIRLNLKKIN